MDKITEWLFTWNNGLFDMFARIINEPLVFLAIMVGLTFFLERRRDKRVRVLLAMFIATIAGIGLKEIYHVDRPCVEEAIKIDCPLEYSFPSIHAVVAFTFMLAFLNKPVYPLILVFALLVCASRIYLGVHTFEDITAALIVAPFSHVIVRLGGLRER